MHLVLQHYVKKVIITFKKNRKKKKTYKQIVKNISNSILQLM